MNKRYLKEKGPFARVLLDLDGTLAVNIWPKDGIGKIITSFLPVIEYYKKKGTELEIFTANADSKRRPIQRWLEDHKLDKVIKRVQCGKPGYDVFWDDKAANPYCTECIKRELKD